MIIGLSIASSIFFITTLTAASVATAYKHHRDIARQDAERLQKQIEIGETKSAQAYQTSIDAAVANHNIASKTAESLHQMEIARIRDEYLRQIASLNSDIADRDAIINKQKARIAELAVSGS
jgi:hypothetical protein